MSLIGESVKRIEDRPLLTGSGRFAADVNAPDMLYMRVVRSPVAFGCLTGVRMLISRATRNIAAMLPMPRGRPRPRTNGSSRP